MINPDQYRNPHISLLPFPTYFAPEDDVIRLEPLVVDIGDIDSFDGCRLKGD